MNIFKQFGYALYSSKFIAANRFQTFWKTFRYLLLLTIISFLPFLFSSVTLFNSEINSILDTIKKEVPVFSINNDTLEMEDEEIFKVYNDSIFFGIDETDAITKSSLSNYSFAVVFKKNELFVSSGGSTTAMEYSSIPAFQLTNETLTSNVDMLKSMIPVILIVWFIIFYIVQFLSLFFDAIILGALALVAAKITQKRGTYMQFFTIASYSLTISTLFFAIMNSFQVLVISSFYIYWLVNIVVMLLAMKLLPVNKNANTKN